MLIAGGIAPGINAVIDGITQRHWKYACEGGYSSRLEIFGLKDGLAAFNKAINFHSLLVDSEHRLAALQNRDIGIDTSAHASKGGSILGTCRDDALIQDATRSCKLDRIADRLSNMGVDILYVIGGDGSMRLAHDVHNAMEAATKNGAHPFSVVAIPKTMDNDILWVWQTFGFMSAVEKAREVIELVHTEITSNPRLGIVQLFGSVSGFVVSHAVLASSATNCFVALVPEVPFNLRRVAHYLQSKLEGAKPNRGLVVMAETALPSDFRDVLNDIPAQRAMMLTSKEREEAEAFDRLRQQDTARPGQTPDELRSACLKIVQFGLEHYLKQGAQSDSPLQNLRVLVNEPRHIIRSIPPSSQDIIVGQRLGSLAVDNAMAGYTDCMISQWLTEFVLVPLPLVVLGRKISIRMEFSGSRLSRKREAANVSTILRHRSETSEPVAPGPVSAQPQPSRVHCIATAGRQQYCRSSTGSLDAEPALAERVNASRLATKTAPRRAPFFASGGRNASSISGARMSSRNDSSRRRAPCSARCRRCGHNCPPHPSRCRVRGRRTDTRPSPTRPD